VTAAERKIKINFCFYRAHKIKETFFAVLLSPVLDGFDQLLSFHAQSLLSINTATSYFFRKTLEALHKPGLAGHGA
jgi:hypothetical protein